MASKAQKLALGTATVASAIAAYQPQVVKPVFEGLAKIVGNATGSGYAAMDESTITGYCALATIGFGAALYKSLGSKPNTPPEQQQEE